MRVAVLEDEPTRVQWLRERVHKSHSIHWRHNAADFMRMLSVEVAFDVVILDHDLGGAPMQPSGPGTGFEVARDGVFLGSPRILVWSFNSVGAFAIYNEIRRRGFDACIAPFATDGCAWYLRAIGVFS